MKSTKFAIPAVALLVAGMSVAFAASELSPGSKAIEEANANMHAAMSVEMTGDVDVDFVRSMIPHHQGAVEMAKIALEYGKDPEIRKLAQEIVRAQETEISFMEAWLQKNALPSSGSGGMDGMEGMDHGAQ
ncbi:MAG: DUF305 domain-containing protein [Mesorhizobium sp.]|nr:DUF305 domain-containing protein [Mesorhizobium sp.]MBL8578746.1 DUF305 domain-containing protein [Mesorhizobium sp.]